MENHPIPQDVTGFQFKLIGDMTVKQFAYLATGVVIGWIFFSLPITPFIRYPIAALFVLCGISFAFIPISGRPIDVMVANFIRSLFSPTQYIYRKTVSANWADTTQAPISQTPTQQPASTSLVASLATAPQQIPTPQPIQKIAPTKMPAVLPSNTPLSTNTLSTKQTAQSYVINDQQPPQDKIEKDRKKNEDLNKKEEALEKEIESVKNKEDALDKTSRMPLEIHKKILTLEEQLREVLSQKEQLAQQIIVLEKKLNGQKKPVFEATTMQEKAKTANVKKIPSAMTKNTGILISPDSPNIIAGIVKDPRGNPLPNILIEIKDKDGNPVRAFKTTVLGQFASSTPLSNDTYSIDFEDPKTQHKFDSVEINVKGEIIPPIEVRSVDTREELRKSLFGQNFD